MSRSRMSRSRTRLAGAALSALATVALLGGCAAGPINVGTLPISGTSIMQVNVQACSPRAGALLLTMDYHQVDPDRVQVQIARWAPTTGSVGTATYSDEGRHWEFTTPEVEAGDCFHIFINTVSMCCDPAEPPYQFGFDYRISYLD